MSLAASGICTLGSSGCFSRTPERGPCGSAEWEGLAVGGSGLGGGSGALVAVLAAFGTVRVTAMDSFCRTGGSSGRSMCCEGGLGCEPFGATDCAELTGLGSNCGRASAEVLAGLVTVGTVRVTAVDSVATGCAGSVASILSADGGSEPRDSAGPRCVT